MTHGYKIFRLKEGEKDVIPESDYGKAEIVCNGNIYSLYSIPMYGGEPVFEGNYSLNDIDAMLEEIESWT